MQYFKILQYQSIAILCNTIAIQYYWNHSWSGDFELLDDREKTSLVEMFFNFDEISKGDNIETPESVNDK